MLSARGSLWVEICTATSTPLPKIINTSSFKCCTVKFISRKNCIQMFSTFHFYVLVTFVRNQMPCSNIFHISLHNPFYIDTFHNHKTRLLGNLQSSYTFVCNTPQRHCSHHFDSHILVHKNHRDSTEIRICSRGVQF